MVRCSNSRAAVLGLVLCLLAGPAFAAPVLDAREILRRAEQVRSPDLDYAVDFRLRTVNPETSWKEREARYTLIAHRKDHSLVIMRSPVSFYPGLLLIADGLYWLLLPRSNRPIQLSARNVLGGDIANGDLARGNLIDYYDARLDGVETIRGEPCWRLELTRAHRLAMYRKIRCWITKKGFLPWRFEYFGETGVQLKLADFDDYREGPLGIRSMRIEVQSGTKAGERSTLTFSDIRTMDVSGLTFAREAMLAIRNAAVALREETGNQSTSEEIAKRVVAGESP